MCVCAYDYFRFSLSKHVGHIISELYIYIYIGQVYTGMPLDYHGLTQCALGYHWVTPVYTRGYTGTSIEKLKLSHSGIPLEKLYSLQPTLEHHWGDLNLLKISWKSHTGKLVLRILSGIPSNISYRRDSIPIRKGFSSLLAFSFAQYIEAMYSSVQVENEDLVRAAPTGDAPTKSSEEFYYLLKCNLS